VVNRRAWRTIHVPPPRGCSSPANRMLRVRRCPLRDPSPKIVRDVLRPRASRGRPPANRRGARGIQPCRSFDPPSLPAGSGASSAASHTTDRTQPHPCAPRIFPCSPSRCRSPSRRAAT